MMFDITWILQTNIVDALVLCAGEQDPQRCTCESLCMPPVIQLDSVVSSNTILLLPQILSIYINKTILIGLFS